MPIDIRPANPNDWPIIVEFNCLLAEESEGKKLDRSHVEPGVRALLADARKGRYLLASVEGRVVGQLMHTFEWSDWRNGDIWWLQSVYIHPDYRSQGVFRRLFNHVAERARADANVVGLRLYVEDHNERAHAVYERLGLEPAGYRVMEAFWRRAPVKAYPSRVSIPLA